MDNIKVSEKAGVRYLPKTADAIFKVKGEIAFLAKTNTEANVDITVTKTDKKGGTDNQIVGTIYSDKAVSAGFTAVDWQPEFLAAMEGKTIEIGKQTYTAPNLSATVAADKSIVLDKIPADKKIHIKRGSSFVVFDVPEGGVVSLTTLGVSEGECVQYIALYEGVGKRIGIGVQSTPLVGELIMTSPMFEGTKGEVGRSEYNFPVFQFDGNFAQKFGTDASYQLKGTAIADDSAVCGEGAQYGTYKEIIFDEGDIMSFSKIAAAPAIMELDTSTNSTGTIQVFGSKGITYGKTKIPVGADLSFATKTAATATVTNDGVVTAVASGTTDITATYKGLTAIVKVTVA